MIMHDTFNIAVYFAANFSQFSTVINISIKYGDSGEFTFRLKDQPSVHFHANLYAYVPNIEITKAKKGKRFGHNKGTK